jgi:hypothetical protein
VRSTISRMKVLDLLVFVTIAFLDLWPLQPRFAKHCLCSFCDFLIRSSDDSPTFQWSLEISILSLSRPPHRFWCDFLPVGPPSILNLHFWENFNSPKTPI